MCLLQEEETQGQGCCPWPDSTLKMCLSKPLAAFTEICLPHCEMGELAHPSFLPFSQGHRRDLFRKETQQWGAGGVQRMRCTIFWNIHVSLEGVETYGICEALRSTDLVQA